MHSRRFGASSSMRCTGKDNKCARRKTRRDDWSKIRGVSAMTPDPVASALLSVPQRAF